MLKEKIFLIAIFVFFNLLFSSIAFSQKENELKAHSFYLQAKEHYEKLEYESAIKKLDEAYALFPLPIILLKKAEIYEKMGKIEESYETYKAIEKTDDIKIRKKVIIGMKIVEEKLSKPVHVSIVTDIPNVDVKVNDEKKLYKTPFDIELKRGKHKFVFSKEGYKTLEKFYEVKGAFPLVFEIKMEKSVGRYVVQTNVGTLNDLKIFIENKEVKFDDFEKNKSQSMERELEVGRYSALCKKEKYLPINISFIVKEGETVNVLCEFKKPLPKKIWKWVALGGSVVSLGVGTGLLISYSNDKDELKKRLEKNPGTRLETNKHIFGGIFLALGVASGVTSYFLFTQKVEKEKTISQKAVKFPSFSFISNKKEFFFSSAIKF